LVNHTESIDVSVIVPCRNEEGYILETIKRIMRQEGAGETYTFELLVIDGKSTDRTVEIIKDEAKKDIRIKLLINEKRITPSAFNMGIKSSRGRYICILGAHAEIANDYIISCLHKIQTTDADNVGGPWKAVGHNYTGKAVALAFRTPFAVGNAKSHMLKYEGYIDSVWGGFYKREVFDKIQGFDEELVRNQDDELNYRLTKSGGKIWQSPEIKYSYICRSNLVSLFRQYTQYGYWKVRVIQKHGRPSSCRHLVPGAFLVTLVLLGLFAGWSSISFWLLVALGSSYIVLVAGSCLKSCIAESQIKLFPIMPAILLCFHFGYGYGFLKGILDFFVLRTHKKGNIKHVSLTR